MILAAAVLTSISLWMRVETGPVINAGYAPIYSPAHNRLEARINEHDGQAFASLAADLSLSGPRGWQGGPSEEAFRASRPLTAWIVAGLALGQRRLIEWSLVVFSVIAMAALVAAAAWVASELGADPLLGGAAALVLGFTSGIGSYIGLSDGLATALVLAVLALWLRGHHGWAVVLLAPTVLARESGLLLVFALAISEVTARRPRQALPLLIPTVVYGAWLTMVYLRMGYWPWSSAANVSHGVRGYGITAPLEGILHAAGAWSTGEWVGFVTASALIAAALLRRPPASLLAFMLTGLGLAIVTGWGVWVRTDDFLRVLLPITIVAALIVLPKQNRLPQRAPMARAAEVQLAPD